MSSASRNVLSSASMPGHSTLLFCARSGRQRRTPRSCTAGLLSQAAGKAQVSLRGQLGKQKQMLDMRAANYIKAIGEDRSSTYLLDALEKVEAEKQGVSEQLARVEQEIELATVKRPTVAQVQEAWSEMLSLWDEGTEEERQELAATFVTRVEVKEKDRASMELMATPTGYGQKFVTNSYMGAGIADSANLLTFPVLRTSLSLVTAAG